MLIQYVWLLHHKASIAPDSPENLDGSTFMLGVGVVPAKNMKEAIEKFDAYLASQKMEVMELWKCEQWDPKKFAENSQENRQINGAAEKALANNQIHYTCGISSEALDCEGN